ncbi:hypothetical protein [Micromonospora sp. NPDC005979]|uniref:hypothetical protein n=1 Tax=Micromonospora sp. NPDC005979 TaxID=3156726 RepID=UPI0033B1C39F
MWADACHTWWHLWLAWSDGQQVNSQPLGPWTVLIWGRAGKLMQFVAGLVVVVDLLDPEKLRGKGRVASRSIRAHRALLRRQVEVRSLLDLEVRAFKGLTELRFHTTDSTDGASFGTYLRREPPTAGPGHPFTNATYQQLWRDVGLALPESQYYLVDTTNPNVRAVMEREIRNCMQRVLPYEVFAALLATTRRVRRLKVAVWFAGLLLGFVIPATTMTDVPSLGDLLLVFAVACLVILTGMFADAVAAWFTTGLVLVPHVVRSLPALAAGTVLAGVLDKSRPLHVLRWLALLLFVVGFHFDLLAS